MHTMLNDCKSVMLSEPCCVADRSEQESPAETCALSEPAQIAWMEVFETGFVELDAWHRKLIEDCNYLLRVAGMDVPWLTVVARAELLVASCLDHFRFEEAIMAQNGFPRREAHIEEHRRIEQKLRAVAAAIRRADGSTSADSALPDQFQAILIDLMVRHDLDYRSHLLHQLGR
jgi:hemerythrin-like metal-binding protein